MQGSVLAVVRQEQFNRYSEAFNFFQSKPVNAIIRGQKASFVILFRDLELLDDTTEYFKRYYSTRETSSRLQKLINYYDINMTPPAPVLPLAPAFPLFQHRRKKHLKLAVLEEKSLARRAEQKDEHSVISNQDLILWQLDQSNFSAASSDKESHEDPECTSNLPQQFDPEPYFTFEEGQIESRAKRWPSKPGSSPLSLRQFADSSLILDFKDINQDQPKINIKPPVVRQIALAQLQKISQGVQTISLQSSAGSQNEEKPKPIGLIPQLQKEAPKVKKENAVLTESIEISERQRGERGRGQGGKASTFMDYYNSRPVKSPSNILEKYIKRKK